MHGYQEDRQCVCEDNVEHFQFPVLLCWYSNAINLKIEGTLLNGLESYNRCGP